MNTIDFKIQMIDHLKSIQTLVENNVIDNLDEVDNQLKLFYEKLDQDDEQMAKDIFSNLLIAYRKYIPSVNFPLYMQFVEKYLQKTDTDSLEWINKQITLNEPNSAKKKTVKCESKLQTLLEEYAEHCNKTDSKLVPTLQQDLLENGGFGLVKKQLRLSSTDYAKLCMELIGCIDI